MNKRVQIFKYILLDWLAAFLTWGLFYLYRKVYEDPNIFSHIKVIFSDDRFWLGISLVPIFWLILYVMDGSYRRVYRKSRLKELGQTITTVLIGVVALFFVLLLDDRINSYTAYYQSVLTLLALQFGFTYTFRLILTTRTVNRVHSKKLGFNTVIVGSNGNALQIFNDISREEISSGNKFIGFVNVQDKSPFKLSPYLPHLGSYGNLSQVIQKHQIEEVIIAIERSEKNTIERIIYELVDTDVIIKVIPMMQDIIFGSVKLSGIFHTPLIAISPDLMPAWQQSLKRLLDVVISVLVLILFSPIYVVTAIGVRLSSRGPILYRQERIGRKGKPFTMYKFRSMIADAEKDGPQLSSESDPRITPFGSFIRKVRLDEIPQFYTVLKGHMSLVGPRPERAFYIEKIVAKAPHYRLLMKIKPGITSWGQVKFGYASTVEEMVERLKYDLLYLENMSLAMDFKIIIYTFLIVFQGRGK
ncbi:MAG: sugar transferase [Bacteroidales bacterium]|nr:sugar transferase [Bacteroidales bacterium]